MSLQPVGAVRLLAERVTDAVGGPDRRRAVLLLTGVLSLSSADSGAIGALAPQLEQSFHIGNVQLGLLVTVSSLVGAVASIPVGVLTDRTNRVRLLVVAVASWAAAMVATGLAVDYVMLLLTRLALGMVTAVAGPVIPSLTGDLFPAGERSRIYGYLLTGELLGAGAGLLVAGNLGAALGWRLTFFFLAAPSLALAALLHRLLPEPPRRAYEETEEEEGPRADEMSAAVRAQVDDHPDVEPDRHLILTRDPTEMNMWKAARYVLSIRSNLLLIVSSALGYFFFAGLRTFAVLFARGRFGISQGMVSLLVVVVGAGGLVGTLAGGYLSDRLIRRQVSTARMLLSGLSFLAAALLFIPGFLSTTLAVSLPIFVLGAALTSAPNPALDAARLDVVPGLLWGRAEAVRSFVRSVMEAAAPLLFGFVSAALGGASAGLGSGVGSSKGTVPLPVAAGIAHAFLVMLAPLALSGVLLLRGRRHYLRDIATAAASEHAGAGPDRSRSLAS